MTSQQPLRRLTTAISSQITELASSPVPRPTARSSNLETFRLPKNFLTRYAGLRPTLVNARNKPVKFLGIESSCDDSCASVLSLSPPSTWESEGPSVTVETDVRISQHELHSAFGGIVPHLAKKAHNSILPAVIDRALNAHEHDDDINAIFVTTGPGLAGSLTAGVREAARAGRRLGVPVYGVNHLEAHVMTSELLRNDAEMDVNRIFPFLTLVVSGGNTFVSVTREVGNHEVLAATRDDALGEALDKAARMLGVTGGGVGLEQLALKSRERANAKIAHTNPLPIPNRRRRGASNGKRGATMMTQNVNGEDDDIFFSFSGLKSALQRRLATPREGGGTTTKMNDDETRADLAYYFQDAAFSHVIDTVNGCISRIESRGESSRVRSLVVSGGVASSHTMREKLRIGLPRDISIRAPPPHWCVDNAVMIAWTGMLRLGAGIAGEDIRSGNSTSPSSQSETEDEIDRVRKLIRPRWPLGGVV